jgi:RNase P subunit RPR2
MATNPLKQFFRQPKIFIKLPSKGIFNNPGTLQGDLDKMPVFGMTGMDEILMKTPDALLNGESTVRLMQSCCPSITDGWDISNLDVDAILVAIRIASYGNEMSVTHTCTSCGEEGDYDINLSSMLDHFSRCEYEPKIVLKNLVIKIKPLTYKKVTEFNLENFMLQKQLVQLDTLTAEQRDVEVPKVFAALAELQNRIFLETVDQVELESTVVTERSFIKEFLDNCDRDIFESIKEQIEANNTLWRYPDTTVQCASCQHADSFAIQLDQSNFFVKA